MGLPASAKRKGSCTPYALSFKPNDAFLEPALRADIAAVTSLGSSEFNRVSVVLVSSGEVTEVSATSNESLLLYFPF